MTCIVSNLESVFCPLDQYVLNKYPSAAINCVPSWKVKRGETLTLLHCTVWLCTLWGCLRMLCAMRRQWCKGGVIFCVISDGKFIYELPCRFMNNMETVSQARIGSYHGKNENSNWKYVEPDLTFISCLSPWCFFWR